MNNKYLVFGGLAIIAAIVLCQKDILANEDPQTKMGTNATTQTLMKDLEKNTSHKGNDPKKEFQDFKTMVELLSDQGDKAVPEMIKESQATEKDAKYRCALMQILSKTKSKSVAESFTKNLSDTNSKVRVSAATQLGFQDGGIASAALLNALDDSDADVRRCAAYSLGQHKNRKAVERLKQLTKDSDKFVSINSIWALGEIGDSGQVKTLTNLAETSDETTKINIVVALAKIQTREAFDALKKFSQSNQETEPVRALAKELLDKAQGRIQNK